MPILACVFAGIAVVGFAARFPATHRWWSLGVVAAAPYLMLCSLVALVLVAIAGNWVSVAGCVVLIMMCVGTQARRYIGADPPTPAIRVSVMTSNLYLGGGSADAVVDAVRGHEVDVLMLEELTPELQDRLTVAGLPALLPYHESRPRTAASGMGLWSRYPLTDTHVDTDFTHPLISGRVAVPGMASAPTFAALHLAGPVPDAGQWSREIDHLPLVLDALSTRSPVVVGGDFNATPDTVQFRRLFDCGYRNGADQAGAGTAHTWPADRWYPPLIAIDHVLTRDCVATSAATITIAGSDHRALLVQVALPGHT